MVCGDVGSLCNGMQMLCVLFAAYSVVSTVTSETRERYERLTSVSSSVDFEQRDNVSMRFVVVGWNMIVFRQYLLYFYALLFCRVSAPG